METIDTGIFRCPECCSDKLQRNEKSIVCRKCGSVYTIDNGRYLFAVTEKNIVNDPLDKIKVVLKKFPGLYNFLMYVVSPVYSKNHLKIFIKKYTGKPDSVDLHLGSGNIIIADHLLNIDIYPHPNVNITADIHNLPIADSMADTVICSAVLEHVRDPKIAVNEFFRVLKTGGHAYCYMPFICGFHASPDDYSRLTIEGMKELFRNFEIIELGVGGGPTSALLWTFQEWLALLLSFGSKKLHLVLYLLIMCATFPLKYIDILLARHPSAKNIACGFYAVVKKR